jgi:hypothetical protein
MSKAAERAARRHIREKATIDRVIKRGATPPPPPADQPREGATTADGLSVEEQVRKEWGPNKGGLPTFWRELSAVGRRSG